MRCCAWWKSSRVAEEEEKEEEKKPPGMAYMPTNRQKEGQATAAALQEEVAALAEAAGERHSLKGKVLLLQSGYHASAWENARGKVIDSLRRLSLLRGIATIWGCLCCVYSRCSACAVSYPVARFPT